MVLRETAVHLVWLSTAAMLMEYAPHFSILRRNLHSPHSVLSALTSAINKLKLQKQQPQQLISSTI